MALVWQSMNYWLESSKTLTGQEILSVYDHRTIEEEDAIATYSSGQGVRSSVVGFRGKSSSRLGHIRTSGKF